MSSKRKKTERVTTDDLIEETLHVQDEQEQPTEPVPATDPVPEPPKATKKASKAAQTVTRIWVETTYRGAKVEGAIYASSEVGPYELADPRLQGVSARLFELGLAYEYQDVLEDD